MFVRLSCHAEAHKFLFSFSLYILHGCILYFLLYLLTASSQLAPAVQKGPVIQCNIAVI